MENHWLIQRLRGWGDKPALVWRNQAWTYRELFDAVERAAVELSGHAIAPGTLAIRGDYSPRLCAVLLAALVNRIVIVPLSTAAPRQERLMELAEVRFAITFDDDDVAAVSQFDRTVA